MDAYSLLRTLGALGVVLGLLAGALWIVRRYDITLPGRIRNGGGRRLEVIERVTLDNRRSAALLRRDGREHLILLAPEGNVMLETGIIRDDIDHAAEAERLKAEREAIDASKAEADALRESFVALVEKARGSVKGAITATQPVLEQGKSRLRGRIGASPPAAPTSVEAPANEPDSPAPAKGTRPRKSSPARPKRSSAAGGSNE